MTCSLSGLVQLLTSEPCQERGVGATAIPNSRVNPSFMQVSRQSKVWFELFSCVQQAGFALKSTLCNKCYIHGVAKLFTSDS